MRIGILMQALRIVIVPGKGVEGVEPPHVLVEVPRPEIVVVELRVELLPAIEHGGDGRVGEVRVAADGFAIGVVVIAVGDGAGIASQKPSGAVAVVEEVADARGAGLGDDVVA